MRPAPCLAFALLVLSCASVPEPALTTTQAEHERATSIVLVTVDAATIATRLDSADTWNTPDADDGGVHTTSGRLVFAVSDSDYANKHGTYSFEYSVEALAKESVRLT